MFEGPEKKVELVVNEGVGSLRAIPEARWHQVVEAAGANVLSRMSGDHGDAYLLSESSLFVWDDHLTMITCGCTLLVDAVAAILDMVGPERVAMLMYERKSENFPEVQPSCFREDAARLAGLLPGAAFRFGDEHSHSIRLFHTTRPYRPVAEDTTLEVLMHGLAPERAALFGPGADRELARRVGLDELLPGFAIDEHLFSPAGYSLNALRGEQYFTVHVTPEVPGSYCSFETNHDFRAEPGGIVSRVVRLFSPQSFDVLAFEPAGAAGSVRDRGIEVRGYSVARHVQQRVGGYDITFLHFFAPPTGPAPAFPLRLS